MPDRSSDTFTSTPTPAQESLYAFLPAMEATHRVPETLEARTLEVKKRQKKLQLLALFSITMMSLFTWLTIRTIFCKSCWPNSPMDPSTRHNSILAPRAPPYQDSCVRNDDCDWGYKCIDNTCYHGCDEDRDCLKPQFCGAWYFPSKYGADFCLVNDFRVCKPHLDFCRSSVDCCSGNCQRKIFWGMCQPSAGRSRAVEEKSEQ